MGSYSSLIDYMIFVKSCILWILSHDEPSFSSLSFLNLQVQNKMEKGYFLFAFPSSIFSHFLYHQIHSKEDDLLYGRMGNWNLSNMSLKYESYNPLPQVSLVVFEFVSNTNIWLFYWYENIYIKPRKQEIMRQQCEFRAESVPFQVDRN